LVFSSVIFLFLFLPVTLAVYLVLPRVFRNPWLLLASLFFYAWGEPFYVLVMLFSVSLNYAFGLLVDARRGRAGQRAMLGVAVVANLGLLGHYKYANFIVENVNHFLSRLGFASIEMTPVHLPIGISFLTFHAMSYVIDIYRKDAPVQRNPIHLALYLALFPQLIAGPIIRYHDVAAQLLYRTITRETFAYGVRRFIVGLSKKVLVANTLAVPADAIFALEPNELAPGVAWLGIVCYTLQIYFDFSGYSDMAIGLGKMFGFTFMENFNYPYISQSIREFWRRWHISLSAWFRDYLYIPIGGNRGSGLRTYFNLVAVFFLCGLWHGASWTFVVWGLFHGLFLVIERSWAGPKLEAMWRPLRHAYVLLVVMIGWVFFRAETFGFAWAYLRAMAGFPLYGPVTHVVELYLNTQVLLALSVGLAGMTPILTMLARLRPERGPGNAAFAVGELAGCAALFILCAAFLSAQTHNPFIYYRF